MSGELGRLLSSAGRLARISRPSVRFEGHAIRPRFHLIVPMTRAEVLGRLGEALDDPSVGVSGGVAQGHAQINLPERRRSLWSPQLELEVEAHPDGAEVWARLGPHPHVWTMYLAAHAVVGFSGLGALMLGLSQWSIGAAPWALLALPVAAGLHAFVAGAAYIGQALASEETQRLRTFIEDVLAA